MSKTAFKSASAPRNARHSTIGIAVMLAAHSAAWAQSEPTPEPRPPRSELLALAAPMTLHLEADGPTHLAPATPERRVNGAPYCADAVNESIQTLSDGNRIVHKTSTRLCRDSEGRTRQETEVDGQRRVFIFDPVANRRWVLNSKNKTASPQMPRLQGSDWQAYGERMREWASEFRDRMRTQLNVSAGSAAKSAAPAPAPGTAPASTSGPVPVVIAEVRKEAREPGSDNKLEREIHVYRIQKGADGAPELPPGIKNLPQLPVMPPNIQIGPGNSGLRFHAPRGPGVTISLGQRDFEGLRAHGERTTWTIEAGKIGNEKPIIITSEKWTSPDLMLTLSSREVDPRTGEFNYRLTHVVRTEPDPALFRVPADFKTSPDQKTP